jgi:TonB-dependent receptor
MKNLLFTFILTLIAMATFGQETLRGKVYDENSNVLPGAHVQLKDTDFSTMSSTDGSYLISGIPSGQYMLVISYIGYEDQEMDVQLQEGSNVVNVTLSEGVLLEEIVVNARLEGVAKAMNAQKNKVNIANVISFEQIEQYPDANMGDALKRISGINVQYDQGEARFANIRGTAPELSSITINGERVPSAEAEERFVQLDLIPADVIETVEVSKAVTPDMDADAIGGSINLITEKAGPEAKIRGTLGSGYSVLRGKPLYKGKLSYSNRFANNKIGLVLNASILDKSVRSDNVEPAWDYADENDKDGSAFTEEIEVRQYLLERLRQSYSATVDFALSENHNIYLMGMYNWRNDWENRFRLRVRDIEEEDGAYIAQVRRETKAGIADNKYARLEDQRMFSYGAGGEHFFNNLKMNWSVTSLRASEYRPNERYISTRVKETPITLDLSDTRYPVPVISDPLVADFSEEYGIHELTEEEQNTFEQDLNGKLDFELPVLSGVNSSKVKFGGRYKSKTKERDNIFYEYEATDEDALNADAYANKFDATFDNFTPGSDYQVGNFISKEFLGDLDLTGSDFEQSVVNEELAGNYDANEVVFGGYAMYTQNLGRKISVLAGLRYEFTQIDAVGNIYDADEDEVSPSERNESSYGNFLPGLHLKYSPTKYTNFRVAWTNTIARPNYYDLVPYREVSPEDNEIKIGNIDLIPTTSMNIDLLGEHYFKSLGLVSGGFFYKNMSNVIAPRTKKDLNYDGNTWDDFEQPVNAGDADLYGVELGVQRRLDFLPSFLNNLTLAANYTFTKSQLKDITLEDREDEVLPLVGTPKNLFNASLAYDTKKFDFRISYSFADAFIEEYDDESFFDTWYDSVQYLDVNVDYKVNKSWKVYLAVNNLLDQPLRYYQGIADRTLQMEYYGINAKFGLKFNF